MSDIASVTTDVLARNRVAVESLDAARGVVASTLAELRETGTVAAEDRDAVWSALRLARAALSTYEDLARSNQSLIDETFQQSARGTIAALEGALLALSDPGRRSLVRRRLASAQDAARQGFLLGSRSLAGHARS